MKTREIEVQVYPDTLDHRNIMCFHKDNKGLACGVAIKAKLIIEMPEKKIEITESQLEDAINTISPAATKGQFTELLMQELGFYND